MRLTITKKYVYYKSTHLIEWIFVKITIHLYILFYEMSLNHCQTETEQNVLRASFLHGTRTPSSSPPPLIFAGGMSTSALNRMSKSFSDLVSIKIHNNELVVTQRYHIYELNFWNRVEWWRSYRYFRTNFTFYFGWSQAKFNFVGIFSNVRNPGDICPFASYARGITGNGNR